MWSTNWIKITWVLDSYDFFAWIQKISLILAVYRDKVGDFEDMGSVVVDKMSF
jgi:hypothetical protein